MKECKPTKNNKTNQKEVARTEKLKGTKKKKKKNK